MINRESIFFLLMKVKTVIICLIITFLSCISFVPEEKLTEIIDRSAVFGREQVISSLAEYSKDKEITIFGETHYLQEHQEFIVEYLKKVHSDGRRLFLNEMINAYGYVINEYIQGNIDEIPTALRYMDNCMIEGLKEFNLPLDKEERILYAGIDMNHWPEAASKVIGILSGLTTLPEEIFKLSKIDFFDDNYPAEIEKAHEYMNSRKNELTDSMGGKWYKIFHNLLRNELESIEYRRTGSEVFREKCMYRMITDRMNQGKSSVLNVGMYHAQKKYAMGTPQKRLAQMLAESGYSITAVSFFPAKAELKHNFHEKETYPVNLYKIRGNDLAGLLVNRAESRMSFLPLSNPLFTNSKISVTFGRTETLTYPARIFDVIITYPEGRIPDSMLEFEL